MTVRAIAYARVSNEEKEDPRLRVEAQLRKARTAITQRGWKPVAEVTDVGVTGSTSPDSREGLRSALEALDSGEASALVATELDRITHSVLAWASIVERSRRHTWRLVTVNDGFDLHRDSEEMLLTVARHERRYLETRTREALEAKRANGIRLGRPVEHSPLARRVVLEAHAAGVSLTKIAELLTSAKVPTPRGGQWHASTVRSILNSARLDVEAASARDSSEDVTPNPDPETIRAALAHPGFEDLTALPETAQDLDKMYVALTSFEAPEVREIIDGAAKMVVEAKTRIWRLLTKARQTETGRERLISEAASVGVIPTVPATRLDHAERVHYAELVDHTKLADHSSLVERSWLVLNCFKLIDTEAAEAREHAKKVMAEAAKALLTAEWVHDHQLADEGQPSMIRGTLGVQQTDDDRSLVSAAQSPRKKDAG